MMSLVVQADSTGPQNRPNLLNWQRTKDLGDGIIEVTHTMYNFGEDSVDFHNVPWGGMRNSVFDQMLVSNPDGTYTNKAVDSFNQWQNQVLNIGDTGGWAAFTEKTSRRGPVVGTDRGMAIVFGDTDTKLAEDWQPNQSSWRWGGTDRTRDYLVGTLRRSVYVDPGDAFSSRYYMVLGDVDHIQSTIEERGLVADATYDKITTEDTAASLLGWQVVNSDGVISVEETIGAEVDFHTFAQPVTGSKPLFILEDVDGNEHLSTDPYALSANPYDGLTTFKGILGFVMPGDMTTHSNNYTNLSSIFQTDSEQLYYLDTNMHVMTVSAVPEPTTLTLLLGTGLAVLCQRRKRN